MTAEQATTRSLTRILFFELVLLCIGSVGFSFFEGWTLRDSVYFTAIFMTTIGLGDISPVTPEGRIFAVFLAVVGVGVFFYAIGRFAQLIVERKLQNYFGRRKLMRTLEKMKGHYILCGCGRMGMPIARELRQNRVEFVIVERSHEVIETVRDEFHDIPILHGDATNEEYLRQAGVERARGLATVTSSDAENVYIILTARDLNPKIHLISIASDERSAEKIRRAGAHLVISPHEIGGRRIVQGILRPSVMDFIDLSVYDSNLELQMEQLVINEQSGIANSTIAAAAIRQNFDVIILAIKAANGAMVFNPQPQYQIVPGDTLIALGKRIDVEKMSRAVTPNASN